jgi:hypothetical protein
MWNRAPRTSTTEITRESSVRNEERLFAVVCAASYFPGLQALLNSIHAYHGREIRVHVYVRGFDAKQLCWLEGHLLGPRAYQVDELPLPVLGIWGAKQQVFAHCLGQARCVCLLDAGLVLTSPLDDMFELAAQGKIVSSSEGAGVAYGPDYAIYSSELPGINHVYITTGALCLGVVRHWDLVGLWSFVSSFGAYSPGRGAPLGLLRRRHNPAYGELRARPLVIPNLAQALTS